MCTEDSYNQVQKELMWKQFADFHLRGIVPTEIVKIEELRSDNSKVVTYFDPTRVNNG